MCSSDLRMNTLQSVITTTIQPGAWQNGATGIGAFDTRLIITASDEVQRDVEQLLKMLERKAAKPSETKPATRPAALGVEY